MQTTLRHLLLALALLGFAPAAAHGEETGLQPAGQDAAASASPAAAQPAEPEGTLRLHGGLNLRTDVGVHPIRLDAGAQWASLDLLLVLDPMALVDGQMSTDLLAQWRGDRGAALFGGWRLTTIPLLDGSQLQHSLLLGAAAELPRWFDGLLGGQAGIELASAILKHGAGIPSQTISFASGRHYIDQVNFSLFLRLELGGRP